MRRIKKTVLILSACAFILLIAVTVLLLVDFDSPEIGEAFMKKASKATGLQFKAEGFRLNLLRGLNVENMTAAGDVSGKRMDARIQRLAVKHQLLPLLRGRIFVDQIVVENPEVELYQSAPRDDLSRTNNTRPKAARRDSTSQNSSVQETSSKALNFEISEFRVENAVVTFHSENARKRGMAIKALFLKLNDLKLDKESLTPLHGLTAKGEVRAGEIHIGKTLVQKNQGQIQIAQGELHAKELTFVTDHGSFYGQLDLNFKSSPIGYKMELKGNPVNTNAVLGDTDNGEYGPAQLEFHGEGIGTDSRDVKGNGNFALEGGKLPSSPVLVTVESILGRSALVGASYKTSAAPFRVQENRIFVDRFTVQMEKGSMDLSGWVSLDGPIGLLLKVRIRREDVKVKEIPNEVLNALTDNEGWVALPFQIRGTSENPITQLDTKAMMAQAGEGTKKMIKQKLTDSFKDLLKKKKPK